MRFRTAAVTVFSAVFAAVVAAVVARASAALVRTLPLKL